MDKLTTILLKSCRAAILGICSVILFLLAVFSACSTAHISADALECTYFVKDHVWINLGMFGMLCLLLMTGKRMPVFRKFAHRIENDPSCFSICRSILLFIGLMLAFLWVVSSQYQPGADQALVQKAVYMLHIKDYSMFEPGGYLSKYPHQLGLVWISYLFSLLFGSMNYLGFQLCNVIGVAVIEDKLSKIAASFGMNQIAQLAVIVLAVLFLPLTMYSSFVYGTVLGLAFSLAAIEQEIEFFRTGKRRNLIKTVIYLTLAVQLKSNYVIFMIGMILYALMQMIKEKCLRFVLVPLLYIGCYIGSAAAVTGISEHVSGYSLDQGMSSWSWIAMGLQEGKRAPGWYNGYNANSFTESGYLTEVHAEMAQREILEIMESFREDKRGALDFFTQKTASQWNNPTYQAFWNVQVRSARAEQAGWLWNFTKAQGYLICVRYLNLLQFVIITGALFACVSNRNCKEQETRLILPMIFAGGFVFHLFWEAKGQYTFPYFVLLIPCAVEGIEKITSKLSCLFFADKRTVLKEVSRSALDRHFPVVLLFLILMNLTVFLYGGSKGEILREDTDAYLEYLKERFSMVELEEGPVQLQTKTGFTISRGMEMEDERWEIRLEKPSAERTEQVMEVIVYRGEVWLTFPDEAVYMTVSGETDSDVRDVFAMKSQLSSQQKWKLQPAENGGFFILHGSDLALTYDEGSGTVYVEPFVRSSNQEWYQETIMEE